MASSLFGRAIFAHAPRTGRMAQSLLLFLLLLWLLTSNYSTCTTAADIDVGFFFPSISWSGLSVLFARRPVCPHRSVFLWLNVSLLL